ncbi:MAG: hypothetical protein ACE5EY_17480 [Anaerolineae bacterium]
MTFVPFLLSILTQETIADPNKFNSFLVLGYAVMWIIATAYIVSLVTRQRNVQQDVALMQRLLQEDEDEAGS